MTDSETNLISSEVIGDLKCERVVFVVFVDGVENQFSEDSVSWFFSSKVGNIDISLIAFVSDDGISSVYREVG